MAESREIKPRRHVFFASMILSAALLTLTRLLTDFGGSTVNIPTNVGSIDKIIYGHSQKPTISDRLFSDPSSFSDLTSNSKECDASQQKSWEARASSGYEGELKDSCIIPKEGLDNYYGPSGPGSSLAATQQLRKMLPSVFQELNIKTFMDAACGDWLWMQTVNLTGVQYFGGDISNITVQKNRDCFGAENIHFDWFDITCMIPPPVDLILVRDILFHLPHHLILEVFANINSSGARYFATTSFSEGENELRSRAIGFHQLNLYASPFNFPLPLHKANDNVPGRHVGIWKLPLQFNIDNSNSSKDSAMTSKNNSNWQHLDITDEPPIHILHVIWGRPLPTDGGYAGKERILDNETFTGCCDSLIELALRSYISILPEDFKILFWNMGGWNTEKYLTHIGLADKNILPMNFDPTKELAGDQNLIEVYEKLSSVVPRSDFVRYAVMRNYGGSYVDIDGIMVRPLPLDGVPRVNLSPTKATGGHITCSGKGYVMQPGSCILSNGKSILRSYIFFGVVYIF